MITDVLTRNTFLVKEKVGFFKAANVYELFDAETGMKVADVQEQVPNFLLKMLKFSDWKTWLPFHVHFYDANQREFLSIHRPFTIFRSLITVKDENQAEIGYFKQVMLSLGGKFQILDRTQQEVATVEGNWKGFDFKILSRAREPLGQVTKKWMGIGKELFTTADNYAVQLESTVDPSLKILLLAAAICVDMVYKESGR